MLLYERHLHGESVRDLAAGLAIPEDRIQQRLRAAAEFEERRNLRSGLAALGDQLDQANRER
jgi:hypothetical protein